jgi:hypothetical protein
VTRCEIKIQTLVIEVLKLVIEGMQENFNKTQGMIAAAQLAGCYSPHVLLVFVPVRQTNKLDHISVFELQNPNLMRTKQKGNPKS